MQHTHLISNAGSHYSQALRLRRICSSTDTLRKWIIKYSDFFVACGYERGKVLDKIQRVLTLAQKKCLQTKERQPMNRIPFVITYNHRATFIAEVVKRNWNFPQSQERLALLFNKPPLVAYRRPRSLRDRLVSTNLGTGQLITFSYRGAGELVKYRSTVGVIR